MIRLQELSAVIVGANTITLVFGTAITGYAYRAYLRTRSHALKALAIGFGLVTIGTLLSGVLHQFASVSLLFSTAIQSVFTAVGLVVLAYSLQSSATGDSRPTYTPR